MIVIAKSHKIDPRKYADLLAAALPKSIETDAENERALTIVNELMSKGEEQLTPEEHLLLRMLVLLISAFEAEAYPILPAAPHEALKDLLAERELCPADLAPILGSRSNITAVLAGKRPITDAQARSLAEFFRVPVGMFTRWRDQEREAA